MCVPPQVAACACIACLDLVLEQLPLHAVTLYKSRPDSPVENLGVSSLCYSGTTAA